MKSCSHTVALDIRERQDISVRDMSPSKRLILAGQGVGGLHAALAVEVYYNEAIKTIGDRDCGAIPPFGLDVGRPHQDLELTPHLLEPDLGGGTVKPEQDRQRERRRLRLGKPRD